MLTFHHLLFEGGIQTNEGYGSIGLARFNLAPRRQTQGYPENLPTELPPSQRGSRRSPRSSEGKPMSWISIGCGLCEIEDHTVCDSFAIYAPMYLGYHEDSPRYRNNSTRGIPLLLRVLEDPA